MSSRDVYEDLPEFDIGADLERLTIENEQLHQRIVQLEAEVASLTQIVTNLKKVQQNLTVNISELYKTALNEINRKNQTIIDLRLQLDDLIFKRQQKDDFKHRKVEIVEKKRCRSPSLNRHTSKRSRSEFNRSKSYDRHLHKISPRKSLYTERRDDRSHHRSKTRERSCTRERSKDSQKHRDKDASKRDHKKSEKSDKSKKHKRDEQISNSAKENVENRKVDDDNFLKTANTKGNIYKKELFHDQNVVTNHKRSEKRRIDVVTKKLFEKAEQIVKATKPVVDVRKDEKQSMKQRPIEGDKPMKTVGAEINNRGDQDEPLLEKKEIKMTSSESENLVDNAKSESAETKPVDSIKADPPKETAEKQNRIEETIEEKKDNEIDKKPDLETNDKNEDNSNKDRDTETKNNGIIGTTVGEEVKIATLQETEEKSPEKIVTAEDASKSQIASKPSDLSLESQMNDLFNSPLVADQTNDSQTDTKTIEEIPTTTPNQSANSNDLNLKHCIVQLKSDDIVNNDDKKTSPNQPTTPSGRILRSSTKRTNYNHLFDESPTKPIKPAARTKRRRPTVRQNPPLPTPEADDIPVLHINEDSATKCGELLELAQIELTPEAQATVVASTPQKPSPDMALLLTTATNSDNSLTNVSNISNTGVKRPKRRRCFIKMID